MGSLRPVLTTTVHLENSMVNKTHGGPYRNAGRRSADGAKVRRHMVTLDAQTVERLKAPDLGDGQLSIGIRRAAASLPRK